jgi:hypothetical protein
MLNRRWKPPQMITPFKDSAPYFGFGHLDIVHPSKNLIEDKILTEIEGVQQSKKEFFLRDGATELDFFHVKYPEGSGGKKKKHLHLDKEKF